MKRNLWILVVLLMVFPYFIRANEKSIESYKPAFVSQKLYSSFFDGFNPSTTTKFSVSAHSAFSAVGNLGIIFLSISMLLCVVALVDVIVEYVVADTVGLAEGYVMYSAAFIMLAAAGGLLIIGGILGIIGLVGMRYSMNGRNKNIMFVKSDIENKTQSVGFRFCL